MIVVSVGIDTHYNHISILRRAFWLTIETLYEFYLSFFIQWVAGNE